MAQQPTTRNHDFESQLELAEMMLNLGRIDEAAVELKKAKDLNEIGAHRHPADSLEHEANLRRLASAMERVEDMQGRQNRTGRIWAVAASIALLGLTGLMFVTWALNRNEMIEMRASSTEDFQIVFAERTAEAEQVRLAVGEQTRQAQQITDLYQENSLYRYQATQNALAIASAIDSSSQAAATTLAQQATIFAQQIEQLTPIPTEGTIGTGGGTDTTDQSGEVIDTAPEPTLVPPTPLSAESLVSAIDQLRVDAPFTANIRLGPGFDYPIIGILRRGDVMTVRAKSVDGYWYDIETEDGEEAWIHTSVAKPISLDWLPSNSNVPLIPRRPTNTPTPEPTETPPNPTPPPAPTLTATPVPTEIPPTAVPPTAIPPTTVPSPTPVPTDVPPTPTDVPPTLVLTPLPGLTTPTSEPAPTETVLPVATDTPDVAPTETPLPDGTETPVPEPTATPDGGEPTPEPSPTESGGSGSIGDFLATITPTEP